MELAVLIAAVVGAGLAAAAGLVRADRRAGSADGHAADAVAGLLASGAIIASLVLSLAALAALADQPSASRRRMHGDARDGGARGRRARSTMPRNHPCTHLPPPQRPVAGDWYTVCEFGSLRLSIGYYIDALTRGDVRAW